jgi:superoxide dismutase, Fe-Mn family
MSEKPPTLPRDLELCTRKLIRETLGLDPKKSDKRGQPPLKESLVITPSVFTLKTERLSGDTKEMHLHLYKQHVDLITRTSAGAESSNKEESASNHSAYRTMKLDETYNLNAVKLHELYFNNISDLASEITIDSLPYLRLSRDFGTFNNWQFDFIAAAMAAREGWAILVFEPYRSVYMNVVVDGHTENIPMGSLPVLVLDLWSHSYYKDYGDDKRSYINNMMREINWAVVEARMAVAERSQIAALYQIRPMYSSKADELLTLGTDLPVSNITAPGRTETVVPGTTPPPPEEESEKL